MNFLSVWMRYICNFCLLTFNFHWVMSSLRSSSSSGVNRFIFWKQNCNFFAVVGLTNNERCLIYNLRVEKHWGSKRIMKMFPNISWNKSSIDRLIRKIDIEGNTRRRAGSGRKKRFERPRTLCWSATWFTLYSSRVDTLSTFKLSE